MTVTTNAPFLTLPDPELSGEGALDPLGLSSIGDRLAEQLLPGLRARMSRPRFLTAIVVAAEVCDGLDEAVLIAGVTPAHLVFEWLLVEGLVRAGEGDAIRGTPGRAKALAAKESGERMSPRAYLRIPSVFGFHGVYKPLARSLNLIDDDLHLSDNGYTLLRCWEREQGLEGFAGDSSLSGSGEQLKRSLRGAVQDALKAGYTTRSQGWQGWEFFSDHLAPARIGRSEAAFIGKCLLDPSCESRSEVFRLLRSVRDSNLSEAAVVRESIRKNASSGLKARCDAIVAFETVASMLESSFDWIRFISSAAGARAIGAVDYERTRKAAVIARALPPAIARAEAALACMPSDVQLAFGALADAYRTVGTPADLFGSALSRHSTVQKNKKPDGKREWFERATDEGAFVRVPYRLNVPPEALDTWNRPYRISAALSFKKDLRGGVA